ncbi:MAG: hypothetical protein DHS20C06_21260 [Hyphobacterium sp.]|nr:MAG: hypothetical protein DHS20C06_21260 [Hyphobacterium sp.]
MRILFAAALVAASLSPAPAQDLPTLTHDGQDWSVQGTAENRNFLGRDAIYVSRGVAWRGDLDLGDLVIEYDYASTHASGFIGVNFRLDEAAASMEQFYTRPHQSGQDDATQYMVMINGGATWQLHAGPNEATAVDLPAREWVRVRIVAIGDRADIYVGDMETPLMHVPDLRFDGGHGPVGLYASDRPWITDSGAYFSNITIRPANEDDQIIGSPREVDPLPAGHISSFHVSSTFPEADVETAHWLGSEALDRFDWTVLPTEDDGVANISRTTRLMDGNNTVFVRMQIQADEATSRVMRFGYSDRVRLYVNGDQLFYGNSGWRARDHRFLGTISYEDALILHLDEGENEIVAAVSESFGGWGFQAAIADQTGLSID